MMIDADRTIMSEPEKMNKFDYACVVILMAALVFIGGLFGYHLAPNMPVFDVTIKAPAAPDRKKVFGDYFESYFEGYEDGMKMGIPVGQLKEYSLLAPRLNSALKQAYHPYCYGCDYATDTVLGEYQKNIIFGDTYIEAETGTRLRIRQMWLNGHWTTDIFAFPSWEDINGVQ